MPSVAHLEPFTSQTGSQAGILSAAARAKRAQAIDDLRSELLDKGHLLATAQSATQTEVQRQISLAEEQIERTRSRLNDEADPVADKARSGLLRELRGMMEHLCRLRGIGEPARCRPANEPARVTRRLDPPVVDVACVPQVQDQAAGTPPVGVQPIQDKQ